MSEPNQQSIIEKVGVIGAGTMGSGIAQVAATNGCAVLLFDTREEALHSSKSNLERILARLVEKGRITAGQKENIQANITYVKKLPDFKGSDLVIEAIVEDLPIKKKVFAEVETHLSKEAIIASNTSSLSLASIAASLQHPERCLGIHFFNPAPLMKLVEVIPAVQTAEVYLKKAFDLVTSWDKIAVLAKDTPGFIVNRVARPFYSEALRIYEEGIADIATIDWAMKTVGGFRMGPFELMDFIGNDVNYAVTESVFTAFYFDPRYRPAFTQKRLAEAGYLGRKSGKGYYNYDENGRPIISNARRPYGQEGEKSHDDELLESIFERILVMLINDAADALYLNIATAKDIDLAMTKGVNYPKGLLAWADEKGIDRCVSKIDALYDEYHEDRYRCSPILRKMAREGRRFFS